MSDILDKLSFRNAYLVVYAPMILMAIDFLTGTLNAWLKHKIKSYIMRQGLAKKTGEIIAIVLGEFFSYVFLLPTIVASFISIYVMVMETISICENLDKLGVPVPAFIKRALSTAKDKMDEGGSNDEK